MKANKIIEKVQEYFQTLKSKNLEIELNIKEELLKDEAYLFNENQIGKLKFEIAKSTYDNEIEKVKELTIKLENLQKIKFEIESKYHLETAIKYNCNICKDSGYINGKRCSCFNKMLIKICFDSLGVLEHSKAEFTSFTPTALKGHYKAMKEYCDKFPNTNVLNYIFIGSPGTGKTYLSKCIDNEILNKGLTSIFLTSTELTDIFLKIHLSEIDRSLIFDVLSNCDLLIIDDLGTEPMYKNVTTEYLLTLLSLRLDNKKHFIITTNLTTGELFERYNERLLSRLSDKSTTKFIAFNSNDLRRELK